MLLSTILELSGAAAPVLFFGGIGTALLLRRRRPHLTEYRPEDRQMLAVCKRYEFTDENGKGLGELVPTGQDPHTAAQERGMREGKSFGARAIT